MRNSDGKLDKNLMFKQSNPNLIQVAFLNSDTFYLNVSQFPIYCLINNKLFDKMLQDGIEMTVLIIFSLRLNIFITHEYSNRES